MSNRTLPTRSAVRGRGGILRWAVIGGAFLAVSLSVYHWMGHSAELANGARASTADAPLQAMPSPTARIDLRWAAGTTFERAALADQVGRTLSDDDAIARAVRRIGVWTAARLGETADDTLRRAVAEARRGLKIELQPTEAPDAARVAVTSAQPDLRYAAVLVNALAEVAAEDFRATQTAAADAHLRDAQRLTEQRRLALASAQAQLRASIEQRAGVNNDAAANGVTADGLAGASSAPASKPASESSPRQVPKISPPQPRVENPAWVELKSELDRWRARRDELLVDRTPQHPAVIDATDHVRSLTTELARVPHWDESRQTDSAVSAVAAPSAAQSAVALRQAKLDARIAQQAAAVQQAETDLAEAIHQEDVARGQLASLPIADVVLSAPAVLPAMFDVANEGGSPPLGVKAVAGVPVLERFGLDFRAMTAAATSLGAGLFVALLLGLLLPRSRRSNARLTLTALECRLPVLAVLPGVVPTA